MIQADDLLDIFNAPSKGKLPELVKLRSKAGWTQAQMAIALNIDVSLYVDIEFERVKNPEIIAKAKEIFNSGIRFSPYSMIPTPVFEPEHDYIFNDRAIDDGRKPRRTQYLKFFKSVKGANGITHYLFRNKGGSLESFSTTQLMDYKTQEVQ